MKIFSTPTAILIGFLILTVGLLLGAYCLGEPIWLVVTAVSTTLAAVGTVGAVVFAIHRDWYLTWRRRPILKIRGPYEQTYPYLRRVPLQPREVLMEGERSTISYQLSVRIENTGKVPAQNTSVLISSMGEKRDGMWRIQENWIATPVRWALDVPADIGVGIPAEERNLIPRRPYVFNFGALRADVPDYFLLNTIVMPGNQRNQYERGEYCFEVKAFAEGADVIQKYFHVIWKGKSTWDFEDVKRGIEIYLKDVPPWSKTNRF
jgi:hypothetical protein